MSEFTQFPPQQLPFSRKNKAWRKKHCDWADSKSLFNYSLVRKSVIHKKINYDLINGKLHMDDLMLVINHDNIQAGFIPDKIQHYPIMNSKLNVLRGEESKRVFDFRVVITNPNAISEIENNKKKALLQDLQQAVADTSQSEEEFNARLEKLNDYYTFEWQDMRELRANALLNHYSKEYNIPLIFNLSSSSLASLKISTKSDAAFGRTYFPFISSKLSFKSFTVLLVSSYFFLAASRLSIFFLYFSILSASF